MRVIATQTNDDLELIEEQEFKSSNEDLKAIYLQFGYVKPYDDTKVLPPKGLNEYELMSYPNNRFIIKDGNIYQSDVGDGNMTSNTWVDIEWAIKVQGS